MLALCMPGSAGVLLMLLCYIVHTHALTVNIHPIEHTSVMTMLHIIVALRPCWHCCSTAA